MKIYQFHTLLNANGLLKAVKDLSYPTLKFETELSGKLMVSGTCLFPNNFADEHSSLIERLRASAQETGDIELLFVEHETENYEVESGIDEDCHRITFWNVYKLKMNRSGKMEWQFAKPLEFEPADKHLELPE